MFLVLLNVYERETCVFCAECVCMCVCVRACVWLQGDEFGRFSVTVGSLVPEPSEEKGTGVFKVIFVKAVEASASTVTVSVSCLSQPRLWDRRDAFVRLGRLHETRQTGALVRALRVGALPVVTQGHLVVDGFTLVYVCSEKQRHEELISGETQTSDSLWVWWF